MFFEERSFSLKDGRKCVLRNGRAADAEGMINYLKVSAGETEFIMRYPDEVQYTIEEEAQKLEASCNDSLSFSIVADVEGVIAGNCGVYPPGRNRKCLHRCNFGIALMKEFWGLGIGSQLIAYAVELAKKIGYEQMELYVSTDNERGLALYKKAGFIEYGRRPHALKLDSGGYADDIFMLKDLKLP